MMKGGQSAMQLVRRLLDARRGVNLSRTSLVRQNETHRLIPSLGAGLLGVIYPSVRHEGGICLACFRPPLVMNVRKGPTYRYAWRGTANPEISIA
jgi:hypothetical protein